MNSWTSYQLFPLLSVLQLHQSHFLAWTGQLWFWFRTFMVAVSSAWKNFTSDFCLSLHNLAPVIIIIIFFLTTLLLTLLLGILTHLLLNVKHTLAPRPGFFQLNYLPPGLCMATSSSLSGHPLLMCLHVQWGILETPLNFKAKINYSFPPFSAFPHST